MQHLSEIRFVNRAEIDTERWDNCITHSANGLIYPYSFYLDHMADNWDGLVLDDYKVVMPLPWKKKYNIHYLTQPFLTAQLGAFGNELDAKLLETFLEKVPGKFKYWDLYLNHGNFFHLDSFKLYQRTNFVL